MKFSGKLLGCPLNTTVKSPQISQWRKSFYSRWAPWPLVAYCYTLKSCKFLDICHRKTLLGCIPIFWKTENTVESLFQRKSQPCRWKSNMAAITKRILSTTLESDAISRSGGLGFHETTKTIFQNDFKSPLAISLKDWDVSSEKAVLWSPS